MQRWCPSHQADPATLQLADRHYNRQHPSSPQCAPPGTQLVLLSDCARAYWISVIQVYARHAWPEAWVCPAFRSEGAGVASELSPTS